MNAREFQFRISVELRQIRDVLSCLVHSLLLHRTAPKLLHVADNNNLGSLGIIEIGGDAVNLTYARLNSDELSLKVEESIRLFQTDLEKNVFSPIRRNPARRPVKTAAHLTISSFGLEFYQVKRHNWPRSNEKNAWEKWNFVLDIFKVSSLDDLVQMEDSVAESLSAIVLNICSTINRPQYLPEVFNKQVEDVYDTSFSDCQPYLFKCILPSPLDCQKREHSIPKQSEMKAFLFLLAIIPSVSSLNWIFPWHSDAVILPPVPTNPPPILVTPTAPVPPIHCGPLDIPNELSLHVAEQLSQELAWTASILFESPLLTLDGVQEVVEIGSSLSLSAHHRSLFICNQLANMRNTTVDESLMLSARHETYKIQRWAKELELLQLDPKLVLKEVMAAPWKNLKVWKKGSPELKKDLIYQVVKQHLCK